MGKQKQVVKVLDYEIVNTANGDGWVLQKPSGKLWEWHLGNFTTIKYATKYAVHSFMIARPEVFHDSIRNKIILGSQHGTMHEFFKLANQVEKEGLKMPSCVRCSNDSNCMIEFI